jgi:NAD-dependent deacetylase
MMQTPTEEAAHLVIEARYLTALTGAGISVESGIPPFRGENGIWRKYDPELFNISYFIAHPHESWTLLKKLFYEGFRDASPNEAHAVLARLEQQKLLKTLITQNIDSLHHTAGSSNIVEYHGNTRSLICIACKKRHDLGPHILENLPPTCRCGGVLKPDIVFFGEGIPVSALMSVQETVEKTDAMLVVGTTGEVFPASMIPVEAKRNGAKIIEVNVKPSSFTSITTEIFLQGRATLRLHELEEQVNALL